MRKPLTSNASQNIFLIILIMLAVFIALYGMVHVLHLVPPSSINIAAGKQGSAYYQIASAYQKILIEDGIRLNIVETAGSDENRTLIDSPDSNVDIAIIQGGIVPNNPNINGLGAIFPEPLLVFGRKNQSLSKNPHDWLNKRVSVGKEGSGTRAVVDQLAEITKAPALQSGSTGNLSSQEATIALANGKLDIAFFVAPLDASYLQRLYNHPQIDLMALDHTESLANQLPEANINQLYSGSLTYQPTYPRESIPLITLVTKLVAKDDLHPALVNRLVHAMVRVHRKNGPLVMSHQFPNIELMDIEPDVYAAKLLRDGFSPLESFLPYWVVAQVNRFALLLLPIIFLLLPLFKLLPALLAWRMQSRVYRYYERLHEIDLKLSGNLATNTSKLDHQQLADELEQIEAALREEYLPLKYREQAYIATEHVGYVRKKLS